MLWQGKLGSNSGSKLSGGWLTAVAQNGCKSKINNCKTTQTTSHPSKRNDLAFEKTLPLGSTGLDGYHSCTNRVHTIHQGGYDLDSHLSDNHVPNSLLYVVRNSHRSWLHFTCRTITNNKYNNNDENGNEDNRSANIRGGQILSALLSHRVEETSSLPLDKQLRRPI